MLIYTGGGFGGFLPMIPARDLSDDEVKQFGGEDRLIATGLYKKSEKKEKTLKSKSPEEVNNGR